jgi:hypothetical protein
VRIAAGRRDRTAMRRRSGPGSCERAIRSRGEWSAKGRVDSRRHRHRAIALRSCDARSERGHGQHAGGGYDERVRLDLL